MDNEEQFDIAISFDTTGSMYECLDNVKDKMKDMITKLKREIPGIRLGIIAHGDYDTEKIYVIKHEDLTDDVSKLHSFTQNAKGTGGGRTSQQTMDEAYELALYYGRKKISWRPGSNRTLILIGDCRPHEKEFELNTLNIDWKEEIQLLRDQNVKIYSVQCMGRTESDNFYQTIAAYTFGHYKSLDDINEISDVIMSICYREAGIEKESTQSVLVLPRVVKENSTDGCKDIDEDEELCEDDKTEDDVGIQCDLCKIFKPLDEFPSVPVSESCEHYPGVCLRCVVQHVCREKTCPQPDCKVSVEPTCEQVRLCQNILDKMFLDYSKVFEENRKKMISSGGNKITVFSMSGDAALIDHNPTMSVIELMEKVEEQTKIKVSNQTILYKDKPLKKYKSASKQYLLSDYDVAPHDSLTLIVPLFCIPEDLDNAVFDLSWEFPKENPDFLDASCLAFKGQEFIQVIDWNHPTNKYFLEGAIKHSQRNIVTVDGRVGHQSINVSLKKLPKDVSHLFFTLSSWKSRNLSAFSSPSLAFYPEAQRGNNLCKTTFNHTLDSQAVIMCYVARRNERWLIFDCDEDSSVNGNSKRYNPIRQKIVEMIAKDE